MRRSTLVVAVVVIGALGSAMILGSGNAAQDPEGDADPFPTASPNDTDGASEGDTATEFEFTVDRIGRCGETCRDVTTTLNNDGDGGATNVTVHTRIHADNDTDGHVVWEGTEPIGRLDAGESYTTTERVDLSLAEAFAVQQADGWITIRMVVESDQRTVTITERRNVL